MRLELLDHAWFESYYICSFDVYLYPLVFVLAMIFIFTILLQSDIGFFFFFKIS